jgi:heme/copper-type cytochrome/quinol oxidase subunit 1
MGRTANSPVINLSRDNFFTKNNIAKNSRTVYNVFMSMDTIIQLTGFFIMIVLFLYTTKDRKKDSDKELKTETKESVQNETAQTYQINSILRVVDDHECRIRMTEGELIRYKTQQESIKESLEEIKETQQAILDRLPSGITRKDKAYSIG